MAEKINKNVHLLNNLRNTIVHLGDDKKIKDYIQELNLSDYPNEGAYAQCIESLKKNKDRGMYYVIEVCEYYIKYAKGEIFNPIKYKNEFRKEKYKQLNLDMPKELMEKFDTCLKENNQTKKSVIQKAIEEYISKNEKK